jgi:predicted TPR repeat methyltransferase
MSKKGFKHRSGKRPRKDAASTIAAGMACHRSGDLDGAARHYREALELHANHPDALHLLGLVARRQGDPAEATTLIRTAIRAAPNVAMYESSLGMVLADAQDTDGAIVALERALDLDPDLKAAAYNLGIAYEDKGELARAEVAYERASEGEGALPEASFNLGNLHLAKRRFDEAIVAFEQAIAQRPDYTRAMANLAIARQQLGELGAAADTYRRILVIDPDDVEARHMLAALSGAERARADPAYVARFFDDYAKRFEDVLLNDLSYDTPAAIFSMVERVRSSGERFARALDLGCGTGLAGRALRPACEVLIGVDLSTNMVERAREAGGYDELVVAELLEFLKERTDSFDLFAASDVLNYLGELAPAFSLVAARAMPNALFVFSTEAGGDGPDYRLEQTGRFTHSKSYVEGVARGAGFAIVGTEDRTLRLERGKPVQGHLFALRSGGGL